MNDEIMSNNDKGQDNGEFRHLQLKHDDAHFSIHADCIEAGIWMDDYLITSK